MRDTNKEEEIEQVDLRIRCNSKVRQRFRMFVAARGFENYEEALIWLITNAPPPISKTPVKTFLGSEPKPPPSKKKRGKK